MKPRTIKPSREGNHMMYLKERVEAKVARIIDPIVDKNASAESYELALHELTQLAIRGTMPVSSEPRNKKPTSGKAKS
jgi:hypothetical protein